MVTCLNRVSPKTMTLTSGNKSCLSATLPTQALSKPSVLYSQQTRLVVRWNVSNKVRWVDMFQTGREKIPFKPRPTKTPVFRLM